MFCPFAHEQEPTGFIGVAAEGLVASSREAKMVLGSVP
jgi:hypothetical protein